MERGAFPWNGGWWATVHGVAKSGTQLSVCLVKAMVFPVVMQGCESWTVKKAEREELMLLNYGAGEDSCKSLGLQRDPTSTC